MKISGSTVEINLHLDQAEHFFVAPDLDPLHQKAVYEPGVDTVFTQVRASRLRDVVQSNPIPSTRSNKPWPGAAAQGSTEGLLRVSS